MLDKGRYTGIMQSRLTQPPSQPRGSYQTRLLFHTKESASAQRKVATQSRLTHRHHNSAHTIRTRYRHVILHTFSSEILIKKDRYPLLLQTTRLAIHQLSLSSTTRHPLKIKSLNQPYLTRFSIPTIMEHILIGLCLLFVISLPLHDH